MTEKMPRGRCGRGAFSFHTAFHESFSEQEILCGTHLLAKREGYAEYCDRMIARIDDILSHYKKEDSRRESLRLQKSMWQSAKDKTR